MEARIKVLERLCPESVEKVDNVLMMQAIKSDDIECVRLLLDLTDGKYLHNHILNSVHNPEIFKLLIGKLGYDFNSDIFNKDSSRHAIYFCRGISMYSIIDHCIIKGHPDIYNLVKHNKYCKINELYGRLDRAIRYNNIPIIGIIINDLKELYPNKFKYVDISSKKYINGVGNVKQCKSISNETIKYLLPYLNLESVICVLDICRYRVNGNELIEFIKEGKHLHKFYSGSISSYITHLTVFKGNTHVVEIIVKDKKLRDKFMDMKIIIKYVSDDNLEAIKIIDEFYPDLLKSKTLLYHSILLAYKDPFDTKSLPNIRNIIDILMKNNEVDLDDPILNQLGRYKKSARK